MTQAHQPQASSSQRPGQMTAVMRAVAATGPKVLRIGVVQSGRVVEERIIKQRTHVTIGPSEKSMFVIAAPGVPANFRLFELVGGDYCLNFLDGMSGRIALPTGISDLNVLRGQARRTPQGAYQVRLTEDSRGKVVVADVTFLFQFVAPPPVQPKPQLPVSVTRGAGSVDWPTTIIAAFSFLLHFLAIGALYSDWLDPVVDDDLNVAGLIDSMKSLPAPPVEEQVTDEPTEPTEEAEKAEEVKPKATSQTKSGEPGQMTGAQAAALSNELEQMAMDILAFNGVGPATEGVLRESEVATGALDKAAASAAGVGASSGDLRLGKGGGAIRPGEGGTLAGIGSTGRGQGTEGTGKAQAVKGPTGSASVSSQVTAGVVSNASRVVAGMRAGFRACYQRALNENPDAQGSIRLTIRVGPGGEVAGVSAAPSGSLPASVVGCVQARAQAAQFAPPDGGSAVVVVPVTFVKQ